MCACEWQRFVHADVQSVAFGISKRMLLKRDLIIQTNCSFREQSRRGWECSLNAGKFRW